MYKERITFLLSCSQSSKHTYFTLLLSSRLKADTSLTCGFVVEEGRKYSQATLKGYNKKGSRENLASTFCKKFYSLFHYSSFKSRSKFLILFGFGSNTLFCFWTKLNLPCWYVYFFICQMELASKEHLCLFSPYLLAVLVIFSEYLKGHRKHILGCIEVIWEKGKVDDINFPPNRWLS